MNILFILSVVLMGIVCLVIVIGAINEIRDSIKYEYDQKQIKIIKHELMVKFGLSEKEARRAARIIYHEKA